MPRMRIRLVQCNDGGGRLRAYTLLGLVSLFFLRYRKPQGRVRTWWSRFVAILRNMDDARLYSLLCIVIIFTFYCIPKSKRSVYLLPIYPFIAYFLLNISFICAIVI